MLSMLGVCRKVDLQHHQCTSFSGSVLSFAKSGCHTGGPVVPLTLRFVVPHPKTVIWRADYLPWLLLTVLKATELTKEGRCHYNP